MMFLDLAVLDNISTVFFTTLGSISYCKCFKEKYINFKTDLGTTSLLIDGDGGQNLKHTFC